MSKHSNLLSMIVGLLYPFILLVSFYVILNGHQSPGGGFQGGAMMSCVFMSRYLVNSKVLVGFDYFQAVEKLAFVLAVSVALLFFIFGLNQAYPQLRETYMVAMNALIALKVCCGLSLVFFRFVFFESR